MLSDEEIQRLRDRTHKIADELHEHRLKLGEHELRINHLSADVIELRDAMATSDQVETVRALLTLKLDHLSESMSPIKRGVNAVIWLIITLIISALLGLLIRVPVL